MKFESHTCVTTGEHFSRRLKKTVSKAAGELKPQAYLFSPTHPKLPRQLVFHWGTLRISMSRERSMGKGASLGKEAALTDSGWAGEISARVGRVKKATFSAAC